jgi:ASC-1-like (ASCH) protein
MSIQNIITVNDPWYDAIKNGSKIWEGRRAIPSIKCLQKGDYLFVGHHINKDNTLLRFQIGDIILFPSFKDALQKLGLENTLPGVKTIEEGVEIYKKYVSLDTQHRDGVVMIKLSQIEYK